MANESELSLNDFNSSDDDYYDAYEDFHRRPYPVYYAIGSTFIIFIIVGVVTNVLGLASLIHFRMWLKHEGYVYLVAMFAANIGILLFDSTSYCITHWNYRHYPPSSSEFMCKIWHFLMSIYFSPGWLSVALLFNVYLREHLTQRRRCGCPIFAAKFCTLFASKIVVGIIFGVTFIFGLPYIDLFSFHDSGYGYRYCSINGLWHVYYVIYSIQSGVMFVLPLVFFLPVILLLTLCMSRDGDQFGFSAIEERSLAGEQFRTVAVTLSSTNLFSYFLIGIVFTGLHGIRILGFVVTTIHMVLCVSIGLQPVLCFIILKEFRIEILRKLRDLGCCKCLPQRFWPSDDVLRVRLQDVEEQPEQQQE